MAVSDEDHNKTYGDNDTSSKSTTASDIQLRANWQEYEISYQIWITTGWLIIVIGSVSHVLSLTVLLGSQRMRRLSLTVYLAANALAGLMALYVGLLRWVIRYQFDVDLRDETSDFGCGLHVALTYMSLQLFSWLQATTAVERSAAVLRPLQYKRWFTWRRNLIVVVSVVLFLGIMNAVFGSLYHENMKGRCDDSVDQQTSFLDIWSSIDLVLFSLLPTAIIVPCNILTLHSVYRSRTVSKSSAQKYIQVTIMLVVQNCVCIATTLPTSILLLLPWPEDSNTAEGARRELEWTILSLLQYLGTTCGFFIYSTLARRFRRSIAELLVNGCNARSQRVQPASQRTQSSMIMDVACSVNSPDADFNYR